MENAYSMHGHTRSLSSLASTIMPVTSNASAFTSATASPMEAQDPEDLPIELKIPLPPSSVDSDEEVDTEAKAQAGALDPKNVPVTKEDVRPEDTELIPKGPLANTKGGLQPAEAPIPSLISLEELAHLVDLERYQTSRTFSIEADMDRLSLACGLDRRLISTFSVAYGNLIDQYKTDDQAGFAGLYEACEQLKASCDTAGDASNPAGPDLGKGALHPEDLERRSCVQMLPPEDQGILVAFLTWIRTEPSFLSDRISSMSPSELTALTSSYHPAGIDFSVLTNHSHGKTQFYSRDSQMMKLSRRMDNLHRFHNQDPLFALLYGVFDSSSRPGSSEHFRRTDIWSTICARNFTEGFAVAKPGSDELVIATVDAFANFQDWRMKPMIETYLMKILAEGSFLLDPEASQASSYNDPIEMHNAKAAVTEADFFDKALIDLFGLLTTEPHHQAIPESALIFVHAILRKIEDRKLRLRAKHFLVCRWYFATFISSIVVYPEVRGLMMTHYIGGTVREMILQRLVVQMQQRVFDVTLQCNNGALVKPEVRDGIMAIFRCFEPPLDDPRPPFQAPEGDENFSTRFLMLSPLDIIGLIQTLYPDRPLVPGTKDSREMDIPPPSTAGSSTLNASTSDAGSALASSFAPSTSGTSTTSRTFVSETLTDDVPTGKEDTQESSEREHGKGPTKSTDPLKPELPFLLNNIYRRLTTLLGPGGASDLVSSDTAWAFIYYSGDGTTLTLSPTPLRIGRDSEAMDLTGDFEVLKTGIVKLLGQNDRSDFSNLEAPVRVECTRASDQSDPLIDLIKASLDRARSGLDFGTAHFWWQTLSIYRKFLSSTESPTAYSSLLHDIADDLRRNLEAATHAGKAGEVRLRSLDKRRRQQRSVLAKMEEQRKALRVKMWYSSDVRHSATYEEALHVTRALRAMASSKRAKTPTSTANWARQRLRGSGTFTRPEAQTLEALSAPKDYGGKSKLADEQVELTSRWLTRRSIENFCKGEERIHRFCFEIQKSIGKIAGPSPFKNPVLWSSNLFRREKASFDAQRLISNAHTSSYMGPPTSPTPYENSRLNSAALHPSDPPVKAFGSPKVKPASSSFGGFWNATQSSPAFTGLGLHGIHPLLPPTPTSPPRSWSSNPFSSASPFQGTMTSPSNSFFGDRTSQANNGAEFSPAKVAFADNIKTSLRSLLISDLGYPLWNQGTETDAWVNDCIANQSGYGAFGKTSRSEAATEAVGKDEIAEVTSPQDGSSNITKSVNLHQGGEDTSLVGSPEDESSSFPFPEAYAMLLQKISLSPDPYAKLQSLYELEDMVIRSVQDSSTVHHTADSADPRTRQQPSHGDLYLRGRSVPRTKATSLEEVIANCTERRAGTLRAKGQHSGFTQLNPQSISTVSHIPATDDIVNTLLSIFRDPKLRPTTLFRDLQYIAAFIPPETLDQTAQGKAFWDAGLAALALKEDLCDCMINRANQITAYHISSSKLTGPLTDTTLMNTTLRDAANIWLITAKEGSPPAARELGLFYLTHPELLPRVTMPFSKANDVYKSVMSIDARTGEKEKGALDRSTFAVVFHWMEFAANGGDKDARDFLKGNGELSGGR